MTEPITVGGNSELETRPYGPTALKDKYGVTIAGFKAVEDSGGPLTVKALVDNEIQLANIYTADPNIKSNDLVALADPDGLFFPDNVAARRLEEGRRQGGRRAQQGRRETVPERARGTELPRA